MGHARSVTDRAPMFPLGASEKTSGKHIGIARASTHSPSFAKLTARVTEMAVEEAIKFAKTQKKDSTYDPNLRAISTYRGYIAYQVFLR